MTLTRATALKLVMIRAAMLLGVLLFGGVTWYLRRAGRLETLDPDRLQVLSYVFMALVASAVIALFFFRMRVSTVTEPVQQLSLYVAGYAVAEGAALFGGVIWFLGGASYWYAIGLVLMVVAFQVLPVPRDAVRQ